MQIVNTDANYCVMNLESPLFLSRKESYFNISRLLPHVRAAEWGQHSLLGIQQQWPARNRQHNQCWDCRLADGNPPARRRFRARYHLVRFAIFVLILILILKMRFVSTVDRTSHNGH